MDFNNFYKDLTEESKIEILLNYLKIWSILWMNHWGQQKNLRVYYELIMI